MRKLCQICSRQYEPQTNWGHYYGKTCSKECTKTLRSRQAISGLTGGFYVGHPPYGNRNYPGWKHTPESLALQKANMTRHSQAIAKEAERYRAEGFEVMELDKIRPDLIVKKNGQILAIEVEILTPSKAYAVLQKKYAKYEDCHIFDDIVWKLQKEND